MVVLLAGMGGIEFGQLFVYCTPVSQQRQCQKDCFKTHCAYQVAVSSGVYSTFGMGWPLERGAGWGEGVEWQFTAVEKDLGSAQLHTYCL